MRFLTNNHMFRPKALAQQNVYYLHSLTLLWSTAIFLSEKHFLKAMFIYCSVHLCTLYIKHDMTVNYA